MENAIIYTTATDKESLDIARALIQEYIDELKEDLSSQNIDREISTLDQLYSAPKGAFILAYLKDRARPAGCVAIKYLEPGIAEMKRLYVPPGLRGVGLGKGLLMEALKAAKALGYEKIRLDSLGKLEAAIRLYKENGFYPIAPYWNNPLASVVYMEKVL